MKSKNSGLFTYWQTSHSLLFLLRQSLLLYVITRDYFLFSETEGDKLDDDSRTEILFDRLMLIELRENVSKLDPKAYAELKSYADPPRVVHLIVKAVLSIFYPDKAREGEFDQWSQCKQVNERLQYNTKKYQWRKGSNKFLYFIID